MPPPSVQSKKARKETAEELRERAGKILALLRKQFPRATTELRHENPFQLLIATILSAQCTDERVNKVTKHLFRKYKKAGDYARAAPEELEQDIRSTGFYKNKAKSIIGCCKNIVGVHGGQVPESLEELVSLEGIRRKTANVILGNAFGIPGITVDTHLKRVSYRLGLTQHEDPVKIEFPDKVFDTGLWTEAKIEARARSYGQSVDAYKRGNLLGVEITTADVAALACAMVGPAFRCTTGAQVPIDGGSERVV